ncbi:MAG: polymer-forming cytoskeletal protein [Gammaproteobacteria bacterium]|nr:polymer-forming cytoskeletal protein [Gammaproteobacteria bacterium]
MNGTQKRRLTDRIGDSPTFMPEGSRLSGDVEVPGSLVACGFVRGDGRVGGTLHMSVDAAWEGEVRAQAGVIAGKLSGRLVIEGKLEIGASAVLRADIVAGSIAVAKGAVIEGTVTVTSGEPVVQFEEKRGGRGRRRG